MILASTLAQALGKMAEYYKYNDSGKQQAREMEAFERGKNGFRLAGIDYGAGLLPVRRDQVRVFAERTGNNLPKQHGIFLLGEPQDARTFCANPAK